MEIEIDLEVRMKMDLKKESWCSRRMGKNLLR
jgi:hypothetical protein